MTAMRSDHWGMIPTIEDDEVASIDVLHDGTWTHIEDISVEEESTKQELDRQQAEEYARSITVYLCNEGDYTEEV